MRFQLRVQKGLVQSVFVKSSVRQKNRLEQAVVYSVAKDHTPPDNAPHAASRGRRVLTKATGDAGQHCRAPSEEGKGGDVQTYHGTGVNRGTGIEVERVRAYKRVSMLYGADLIAKTPCAG